MKSQIKHTTLLFLSKLFRNDLNVLARLNGTDKFGHSYTPYYKRHFEHLKDKPITLLEIGIGGYDSPNLGGESLRMWKAYFPKGKIYGIDIHDKKALEEPRIRTFQGSQDDEDFLVSVIKRTGKPDIIIDDGSHFTHHVIATFKILFPLLKDSGIYTIEDLQTSYWESTDKYDWNGSPDVNAFHTSMNFFKSLADGLNHAERIDYQPNYFDLNITGLHFYHNLVFIEKGRNDELSNMVKKAI